MVTLKQFADYDQIAGKPWEAILADMVAWGLVKGFADGTLRPERWGPRDNEWTPSPFEQFCIMQHRILNDVPQNNTVRDAMRSLVYVRSIDPEAQVMAVGAGFWVLGWYAVTNAHVVSHDRVTRELFPEIQVTGNPGCGFGPDWLMHLNAQVVHIDQQHDLAILEVRPPAWQVEYVPVTIAERDPEETDRVWALGSPFSLPWDFAAGTVRNLDRSIKYWLYDQHVWGLDVPINPGNSGGMLVNIDGDLVGVPCAEARGANSFTFAIPRTQVLETLRDAGVM